jgi:hypothetical protein
MRYQTALRPDAMLIVSSCHQTAESWDVLYLQWLDARGKQCVQQPRDEQDWNRENCSGHERHTRQKEPVAPLMTARMFEMPREQRVIATVGLPGDVEEIAEERYGADNDIESEIHQHPRDGDVRRSTRPRRKNDNA